MQCNVFSQKPSGGDVLHLLSVIVVGVDVVESIDHIVWAELAAQVVSTINSTPCSFGLVKYLFSC